MHLRIATIAERPDLAPLLHKFPDAWPEFMYHDPVANLFYDHIAAYHEFMLIGVDDDERPVARVYSAPFTWNGAQLPPGGMDAGIRLADADRAAGVRGNVVLAVEFAIQPKLRGRGLSRIMLEALLRNAARLGYGTLVAPVRPSAKHAHPTTPIAGYAQSVRPDGLPTDPWLRVHARIGGRFAGMAPRSMVIPGTLEEWRGWTGLPFDATGPVIVPGALVPVHCDVAQDHAVYVEPNVWMVHDLSR
jgi:GNAT superfamily N-acetyltransferase